jgi:hypothetical protein
MRTIRFLACRAAILVTSVVTSSGMLGCGSSGGGGGGGGDPSCGGTGQPPCSTGSTTTLTTAHNYAVHQLFLGENGSWQNYGYNLDGKVTTAASTDVCTLVMGAMTNVQIDGPNGVDNSFGANIVPLLLGFDSQAQTTVNSSINQGKFTVMTNVTGFDDSAGNTTSAQGLGGVILAGANVADAGAPTWNTGFNWAVDPDLLTCFPNCTGVTNITQQAKVQFTGAYQAGGTFVSGAPTQIGLSLTLGGTSIQLNIHSALVTFQPSTPGHVTNGIIAGAIESTDFVNTISNVVGYLDTALCTGDALATIENDIKQKSDIVVNGNSVSNGPGTTCNAISVGLGFTADEIAQPSTIAPVSTGGANPCGTAGGMDGGSD